MSRKVTTEEFLERSKKNHLDKNGNPKYDYSKTVYKGGKEKVIVTCPIHGDFEQLASNHIVGRGCDKCARSRGNDTEEFIRRSRLIHGDKYNYDKSFYIGRKKKLIITCFVHGDFEQTANNHMGGAGCPKCGEKSCNDQHRLSIEEFIRRSRKIHGNKYNYDKVNFNAIRKGVLIVCPTHGEFWQIADNHAHGAECPSCYKEATAGRHLLGRDKFVEKSIEVHGDYYNYEKVEYKGNKIKVEISCPLHGPFWQKPNGHVSGAGCPRCKIFRSRGEKKIERFLRKHGFFYEQQKTFDDCLSPLNGYRKLRYDFYIPNNRVLLEFHGLQHYESVEWFGGIQAFGKAQIRDQYKQEYALRNNYKFCVISHKQEEQIEEILTNILIREES